MTNTDTAPSQIHVEERKLTLHDFLGTCIKINGSDVHLQADSVPMIRVDGVPRFLNCPAVNEQQMKEFVEQVLEVQGEKELRRQTLNSKGAVDLAYIVPGVARFRTNIFRSREKYAMVMRRIVTRIPQFDELSLPAQVEDISEHRRGIMVVSGTTGSGKSTTLAAIIGKMDRTAPSASSLSKTPSNITMTISRASSARSKWAPTAKATNMPCAKCCARILTSSSSAKFAIPIR